MKYFEDVQVGAIMRLGRYTFTVEEIKAFARRFDPQAFHLDEKAAEQSHFGALVASGWHTVAIWMRLTVEYRRHMDEAARARGEPVAEVGPAVGFRDMRWHKPVFVGDTIEYASEVVELNPSSSRPERGLMTLRSTGVNQSGILVFSFCDTTFVERRPVET